MFHSHEKLTHNKILYLSKIYTGNDKTNSHCPKRRLQRVIWILPN
jgi:hypothetical protein